MKYRPEITDESPLANEVAADVAIRGAGRAQSRAVKDPIDSYGDDAKGETTAIVHVPLLERARAAWRQELVEREEESRELEIQQRRSQANSLTGMLSQTLGVDVAVERVTFEMVHQSDSDGYRVVEESPVVDVDGITVGLVFVWRAPHLAVIHQCPKCGGFYGAEFVVLPGFARAVDEPVPHIQCPVDRSAANEIARTETVAEQLERLLRRIAREEMGVE